MFDIEDEIKTIMKGYKALSEPSGAPQSDDLSKDGSWEGSQEEWLEMRATCDCSQPEEDYLMGWWMAEDSDDNFIEEHDNG